MVPGGGEWQRARARRGTDRRSASAAASLRTSGRMQGARSVSQSAMSRLNRSGWSSACWSRKSRTAGRMCAGKPFLSGTARWFGILRVSTPPPARSFRPSSSPSSPPSRRGTFRSHLPPAMSYVDSSSSSVAAMGRRLTNRNNNRYSVTALFSMAAEQDVEVEDDLARGPSPYLPPLHRSTVSPPPNSPETPPRPQG